jgi:hypothetical protein
MGLLDDAIKEHLELKRKHGAPEDEVQRQEEEALGPVRREAVQQPESMEQAAAGASDGDAVAEVGAEEAADDGGATAPSGEEQLFDGEAFTDEEGAGAEESVVEQQPSAEDTPFGEESPGAEEPQTAEEPHVTEEPLAREAPPVNEPPPATERPATPEEPVLETDPEAPEPAAGSGDTPSRGLEPIDEQTGGADHGATVEYDPFAEEGEEEVEEESDEEGDVLEDTPDFLQETPEHDRLWFEQKPPRDFDFE